MVSPPVRIGPITTAHLGFLFLCFLWGSTWIAIRYGAFTAGPIFIAMFRLGLASLLFIPIALALGRRLPSGGPEWRTTFVLGIVLYAGNFGPVYWGERIVPAGLGAILFATMPLQVTLFAHVLLKDERLSARRVAGILVGIAGVYLLVRGSFQLEDALRTDPLRVVAVLLGATGAALATVLLRRETSRPDPVGMNIPANALGALALLPFVPLDGERFEMPVDPAAWGALLYLVVLGSVAGFLVFYWLVRVWPANHVALVNLVSPITAGFLGIVILGEQFDPGMLLGGAVILAGVGLAATAGGPVRESGSDDRPAPGIQGERTDRHLRARKARPSLGRGRFRAGRRGR